MTYTDGVLTPVHALGLLLACSAIFLLCWKAGGTDPDDDGDGDDDSDSDDDYADDVVPLF